MNRPNYQLKCLPWLPVCLVAAALVGAGCGRSEVEPETRQVGDVTAPVPVVRSENLSVSVVNPPETNTNAATTGAIQSPKNRSGDMQSPRQEGDQFLYTQNFPPGPSALLKVEQRMPAEVRVGQPFLYTIQVANLSQFPVHEVTLKEMASEMIEIIKVTDEAAPSQMSSSMASRSQRQPSRDQDPDQGRTYVRAQTSDSEQSGAQDPPERLPTPADKENSQTSPPPQNLQSNRQGNSSTNSNASQTQDPAGDQEKTDPQSGNTNRSSSGSNSAANTDSSQETNQSQPSLQGEVQRDPAAQSQERSNSLSGTNGWTLGTLAPGQTRTLQVTAAPRQVGEAKTCLLVDYQPSLCAQVKVVKPELAFQRVIVNQEGQPVNQAYACDPLFVLYRVANEGSGKTDPVIIRESLPEWITASQGGNQIELNVGELQAGQSVEKRIPVQVTQAGQFSSRAEATTGNIRAQSSQSSVRILQPQLQVNLDGPSQDYLNRAIRYTVAVSNPSQDPASNTVVALEIPQGASRITYSSQQVEKEGNQFKLGTLNPGENKSFTIAFEASQPGQLTTRATAQAYCAKAQTAELTTQVQGVPAVRLEVVDLKDPVPVGEETTYAIRVKNQGSAKDLNIQLQAQLPKEMQFVSAQGDSKVESGQEGIKFAPVKELPPGATAEWLLKAKASQTNKVMFQVQMSSDSIAQNVMETESTTLY